MLANVLVAFLLVEGDQGDVGRDSQGQAAQGADHLQRYQAVRGEQCGGRLRQCHQVAGDRRRDPVDRAQPDEPAAIVDACGNQLGQEPVDPIGDGGNADHRVATAATAAQRHRRGQERDAGVAGGDQVARRLPGGVEIVHADRVDRQAGNAAVQQHQWSTQLGDRLEMVDVGGRGRGHDQPVDPSIEHHPDRIPFELDALRGVRQQDVVAVLAGGIGDTAHRQPEVGVLDVPDDDAEGLGPAGGHAPGKFVGSVVQGLGGRFDPLQHRWADCTVATQRSRGGGLRDSGQLGHVADRCRPTTRVVLRRCFIHCHTLTHSPTLR